MSTISIYRSRRRLLLAASVVSFITACGGGGSDVDSTNGTEIAMAGADTGSNTLLGVTQRKKQSPSPSYPAPAPTLQGRVVEPQFFGMHLAAQRHEGWPTVKFATQRIWDSWPNVAWQDIHKGSGTYNWVELDALVADSLAHGVELVYTFGYVPQWASTNRSGDCNGAAPGSCYAPNAQAWQDFVRAITTRYKGKIKYWEIWNEPNAGNFWKGTHAQMASMAKDAYGIIRGNGGVVLSPAPQGMNSHTWLDSYFAAGGAPYTDIVTFHGYVYGVPEKLNQLIANIRTVRDKHGLSAKPIWDTEHSWGDSTWPMGADEDQQAAWLARYQVLSFFHGIERSFWYGWEHFNWGTLFDRNANTVKKPGIAYRQVYDWMIGANFHPCQTSTTLYTCKLQRANGYEGQIVWSASGTANYTVPTGYVRMKTIDGQIISVYGGQVISANMKPVLIEK